MSIAARLFLTMIFTVFAWSQNVIFSDDFESGAPAEEWELFWENEEGIQAVEMTAAPVELPDGGSYTGYLQDSDGTYTGAALAVAGGIERQNYTVTADVYCYANHPGGSAYTGVVAYADSAANYYVKLVADFDGDNRFRLYNNDFDMGSFEYSFHHAIDATGLYEGDGWHTMALEVNTLEDGTAEYTAYFDGQWIGGPFVDDSQYHTSSGQYGVFSFQQGGLGLPGYFDNVEVTEPPAPDTILFEDNFESGFPHDHWISFWENEENIDVVNNSSAPQLLGNGGDYVGFLQDEDGTYTGAALAVAGNITDQNYTIEADVYCYSNHPGGSAYTGIAAYADPDSNYYVKLVADFDGDNRFRLYNNDFDMGSFEYSFHHAIDATGLYDGDGWHKMALAVETLPDGTASYTAYFDGELIGGPFVDDSPLHTSGGMYGVFSFQQGAMGIPGYFDNVRVTGEPLEVVPGDVNSDLTVDVLDIVLLVSIILGTVEPIDILDAVAIVGLILNPDLMRGLPVNSAEAVIDRTSLHVLADGDIAGIQITADGMLQTAELPAGWLADTYDSRSLLINLDGSSLTEMELIFSDTPQIREIIVADWHGNTVVLQEITQPSEISLDIRPNPFNPVTTLKYQIPKAVPVHIRMYDLQGRLAAELVNEYQSAGSYQVQWDASGLASGIYLAQLQLGSNVVTKKCTLMK